MKLIHQVKLLSASIEKLENLVGGERIESSGVDELYNHIITVWGQYIGTLFCMFNLRIHAKKAKKHTYKCKKGTSAKGHNCKKAQLQKSTKAHLQQKHILKIILKIPKNRKIFKKISFKI